jgi:hypothetical protein
MTELLSHGEVNAAAEDDRTPDEHWPSTIATFGG